MIQGPSWRQGTVLVAAAFWLSPGFAQSNRVRWSRDYVYANGQILATIRLAGGTNAPQAAIDPDAPLRPGAPVTLKGSGFRPTSVVNIHAPDSSLLAGPIRPEAVTDDSLTFRWPAALDTPERLSIRVVDSAEASPGPPAAPPAAVPEPASAGASGAAPRSPGGPRSPAVRSTGNLYGRYAHLVPGHRVAIHSVAVQGKIVTIKGRGFTSTSVVRFTNLAGGELNELGLWRTGGTPRIPVVLKSAGEVTFGLPTGAGAGPVCIQVLNSPYSDIHTSRLYTLRIEP